MPYLTPDEIPEGDDCRPLSIPASSDWLAIVSGALTELTKTYNWEQEGTVTVDEAAERMQEMLDAYYDAACGTCELPEGGKITRINEDNIWEELVDGVWQPTTGDYAIPEPEARTEPTAEERRCLAAANAENTLLLMYENLTDSFGEALGTVEALAELVGFVGAFIVPGLGLAMRALITIGIIAFKEVFDFTEFITADFWTEAFTQNMRCTLYECSEDNDGVVTFDFSCVWERIKGQIEWLDPTISSAALAGQVLFMLNSIGAQGLNLAGTTTAIESADCDVCSGEAYCIQNTADADNGWTLAYGVVNGAEWRLDNSAGFPYLSLRQSFTVPFGRELNTFLLQWATNGYSGLFTVAFYLKENDASGATLYSGSEGAGGSNPTGAFPISLGAGTYYFQIDVTTTGGAGQYDPAITKVIFEGTGSPPMDGQVCE